MEYRDTLRTLRDCTAPDPEAVARVRKRLDHQLESASAELAHLPSPDAASVARVRSRLREARQERRRPWLLPVGAVAMAAAALVAVAWPEASPEQVDLALAGVASEAVALAPHVRATHDGQGSVAGTTDDLVIDWDAGRIEVEVTPEMGVAVQVRTSEGIIQVVGTVFSVERDALGTRVEVTRGKVQVDCVEGADGALGADQALVCEPTTAAGLLARGRALQDAGAAHELVLEPLDRGLQRAEGVIRGELQAARLGPLLGLGRHDDALAAAEAALVDGAPRAEGLHRAAARLRLATGDCEGALPHLDALQAPTADERAHRDRCAR